MTDFDEEEIAVLKFLSDGKEHFDDPDIDDYYDICEELEKFGYVDMGLTKDDGIKLTRKGKKVWNDIQKEIIIELSDLEFSILNTTRLHEKEFSSNEKNATSIYDYITLYTKTEIAECTLIMQRKGWIKCFCDEGPAYYHTLTDEGRVILRKYIEQNSSSTEPTSTIQKNEYNELVDELTDFFYGNVQVVKEYIEEVQKANCNIGVLEITVKYLQDNKITTFEHRYCQPLYTVLNRHNLYSASLSNWDKLIKNKFTIDKKA